MSAATAAPAPILPGVLAGVSNDAHKRSVQQTKSLGSVKPGTQAEAVINSGALNARSYEPREYAPVVDPLTITDVYADGGVIHQNPAPLGGVFAFCYVNVYGERIADYLQRLAESKYPDYLESHARRRDALESRLAELGTEASIEAAARPNTPEECEAARIKAERIAEEITDIAAELEATAAPLSLDRYRVSLAPTKHGKRKDGTQGDVPQIYEGWGHLPPRPDLGIHAIGNNYSELAAVVAALGNLPIGWRGRLWTDSKVTIDRCRGVFSSDTETRDRVRAAILKTCPRSTLDALLCHLARIGMQNIDFRHLKGHPSPQDLERGANEAGQAVSKFNVWCDEKCKEVKARYAGN